MTNAWIITTSNQIASLVEAARAIGPVTVIALGDEATGIAGVDRVVAIGRGSNAPLEAFAPAVNAVLEGAGADIVFAANRPVERVLAGAVAARLGLPLINGALRVSAGEAEVSRFGGLTQETISFPGGAVVVLEGGAPVEGAEVAPEAGSEEHYEASVSAVEPAGSGPANLAAARRIVAAGRGFKAEEDLQWAQSSPAPVPWLKVPLGCQRIAMLVFPACTLLRICTLLPVFPVRFSTPRVCPIRRSSLLSIVMPMPRSLRLLTTESWATSTMSCLRLPQHFPEEEYV